MAISGGYSLSIIQGSITATTVSLYAGYDDAAASVPYKIYASDGTTVVQSGTSPSDSIVHVTGLTPETTYIAEAGDTAGTRETFTTLADEPKVATESMWADLASKVKTKSDVVITMTTTDPGEGSGLAANNYVAVYGGDPIILDYSTNEQNTGYTWVDGSAIYKKTVSFGALPNGTSKTLAHGVSNLSRIVGIQGWAYRSTDSTTFPIPFIAGATGNIQLYVSGANIVVITDSDRSDVGQSYITLYYIKAS